MQFQEIIFEETPATEDSAQKVYLKEAGESDIYLGLFGNLYGYEDEEGIHEFGGGGIHIAETTKWVEFFEDNAISWCNYAIGSASTDDTNALKLDDDRYTDAQKTSGHWPAGLISESGSFARAQFLTMSEEPSEPAETTETTEVTEETEEPED